MFRVFNGSGSITIIAMLFQRSAVVNLGWMIMSVAEVTTACTRLFLMFVLATTCSSFAAIVSSVPFLFILRRHDAEVRIALLAMIVPPQR